MSGLPRADPEAARAWCRALFAQLHASGVDHVAVSPGSRSTPLTVAADLTPGLNVSVHLDERSGGFFALGLARASTRPVALVCTSGTAAANYLPAVVEAFHSGVPLLVLTADRPPELRGRGAPQTIDQVGLYGSHLRLGLESPVAGTEPPDAAVALAAEIVDRARFPIPGPVHLNCPLREPLEPPPGDPEPVATIAPSGGDRPSPVEVTGLDGLLESPRGLIAAGPMDLADAGIEAVAELARRTGWPILADPASGLRRGPHTDRAPVLATGEHLLRSRWADDHRPEVVVQLGAMPTSKSYRLWLEGSSTGRVVAVDHLGRHPDPSHVVTHRVDTEPGAFAEVAAGRCGNQGPTWWTEAWTEAERRASTAVARVVANSPFDEPAVVAGLDAALGSDTQLVVANSMPIRDLDAFLPTNCRPMRIMANRGACGIDGLVSTATGVAYDSGTPTVLFTGDLAFLHDLSGLAAVRRLGVDLTVVVVDNDGGGIFSFLPIVDAAHIDHRRLFHTPHGLDPGLVDEFVGASLYRPDDPVSLADALKRSVGQPGLHLVQVAVDARTNVAIHRQATRAVDEALGSR